MPYGGLGDLYPALLPALVGNQVILMEFLQETVLGSKCAVSTTFLSLSQQISLQESQFLLESFYQKYHDNLDALFKCKTVDGTHTVISILNAKDSAAFRGEKKLYAIKTAGSADDAQLSELTRQCRLLQTKQTISELSTTGFILNPLLAPDFICASQQVLLNSSQTVAKPSGVKRQISPTETAAPAASVKPSQKKIKAAVEKETLPTSTTSSSTKPTAAVDNTAAKKITTKPSAAFPFPKTDKAKALKKSAFDRKPLVKPVNERVVVAEANDLEAEPSDDSIDFAEKPDKDKEAELKNLENLFENDDAMDIDDTMDINDAVDNDLEKLHVDKERTGSSEPEKESPNNDVSEPVLDPPVGKEVSPQNIPSKQASPSNDIVVDQATGKRMRRIKKTITVDEEDEEGFSVRKSETVETLVEVDDSGLPVNKHERKEFSNQNKLPSATTHQPDRPSTSRPNNSAASKRPASKPKPGTQGTLMSFFNVKKR